MEEASGAAVRGRHSAAVSIILISGVLGLTTFPASAQSCTDATVMSRTNRWEKRPNGDYIGSPDFPRSALPAVFRNTDAYGVLFASAYPEGKGGLIAGNGMVLEPREYSMLPALPYKYEARFFPYWCNSNRDELVTDPNYLTDNNAFITANDIRYVLEQIA